MNTTAAAQPTTPTASEQAFLSSLSDASLKRFAAEAIMNRRQETFDLVNGEMAARRAARRAARKAA